MFLSMQIILHRLQEYPCDPHLQGSEMSIWSASPLYQGGTANAHTVYVCPSEQYISSMKGKVICVNRNSYIVVDHDDWEEILEKVVHIIEEYIEWDLDTRDAITAGCSLQEVVDRALPFIKAPIGVGNNGFIILAFAGKEYATEGFEMMDYLSVGSGLPTNFVTRIIKKYSHSLHSDQVYFLTGENKNIEGFAKNIFINDVIWGTCLIFIPYALFSEDMRQVFATFSDQIDYWRIKNPESDHYLQYQRILEDLLDNTNTFTEEELDRFFSRIGWSASSKLSLFVTQSIPKDSFIYYRVRYFLISNYPACLFVYRDGSLSVVLNTSIMSYEVFSNLLSLEFGDNINIGVSSMFRGVNELATYHDQAKLALDLGAELKKGLHNIKDYYVRYFSRILQEGLTVHLIHPLIIMLKKYDSEASTQLYNTLKQFLLHERRHDKTALALGIHVNTLKYRLNKIYDLADIDFDDISVRIHLLVSFALQDDGEL